MMEEPTPNESALQRDSGKKQAKLRVAMNLACASMPYLAGLAAKADIQIDDRIKTACVFDSGRMLLGTEFFDSLNCEELAFVLAHELLHLFLKTGQRQGECLDRKLINIAHDFIINEMVLEAFGKSYADPPGGGLNWRDYQQDFAKRFPDQEWKPAMEYSLEELVQTLKPLQDKLRECWKMLAKRLPPPGPATLGDLLAEAGIGVEPPEETPQRVSDESQRSLEGLLRQCGDVLTKEIELEMFPDETIQKIEENLREIQQAVARSTAEQAIHIRLGKIPHSPGVGTGDSTASYALLRGVYQTPWEAAVQRWFDAVAPGERSWGRPSRRGAFRTDVVLPGRKREGWTLHIVLDTSGSMVDELSSALGAIDQFCQGNGVEMVHVLQCDAEVTSDEYVEVGDLEHFQIHGFGGSDMSPAMRRLAEDPEVEAVIVLTDGYIYYPEEPMPYETLWCLTSDYSFDFPYGTTISIRPRP
ncbi:MAG: VWA-like domain-containing protein [Planctomycetia bacterium]|nr:VWA-like domain-containing protein [Planctomycetia bacterium]